MNDLIHHNRSKVKLLKYIFLSVGFCIFSGIFITAYLNNSSLDEKKQETDLKLNKIHQQKKYDLTIDRLIFEGINDKSLPYQISAQTVIKNHLNEYNLGKIDGQCSFSSDKDTTLKASKGILDDENKIIKLQDDVEILFDNIAVNTQEMNIDLKTQDINSDSSVVVKSDIGNVKADSMKTKDSTNKIEFKGNVESICVIKN